MKVLKFGGTSVGSPERMKGVCQLINDGEKRLLFFRPCPAQLIHW